MRRPFQDHITAHGMKWLTIQAMRTTFASLLATTGLVSIQQIADWLGDTIKVTEDRYAHLLPRHDLIEKAFRDRVDHSGKSLQFEPLDSCHQILGRITNQLPLFDSWFKPLISEHPVEDFSSPNNAHGCLWFQQECWRYN